MLGVTHSMYESSAHLWQITVIISPVKPKYKMSWECVQGFKPPWPPESRDRKASLNDSHKKKIRKQVKNQIL